MDLHKTENKLGRGKLKTRSQRST